MPVDHRPCIRTRMTVLKYWQILRGVLKQDDVSRQKLNTQISDNRCSAAVGCCRGDRGDRGGGVLGETEEPD